MPRGWPKAMAPPCGLMRGSSSANPSDRVQAKLWAAKASLSSMWSMSSRVSPALVRACREASTGPMPMMRGSTPTTALVTISANGVSPCRSMPAWLARSRAQAPSLRPLLLPAVTLPPSFRKAGRSLDRMSGVEAGLMNSSSAKTRSSCFLRGMETGTISSLKWPASRALAALDWEPAANRSWSSREMPCRSTRFSAVVPMPSVPYRASNFGLMNRQPKLVSCISASRPKGWLTLLMTHGPRVMCSTPPETMRSASPMWSTRAAWMVAAMPEAQSRLMVSPGTVWGSPARSRAIRATLRLSSPA